MDKTHANSFPNAITLLSKLLSFLHLLLFRDTIFTNPSITSSISKNAKLGFWAPFKARYAHFQMHFSAVHRRIQERRRCACRIHASAQSYARPRAPSHAYTHTQCRSAPSHRTALIHAHPAHKYKHYVCAPSASLELPVKHAYHCSNLWDLSIILRRMPYAHRSFRDAVAHC